MAISYNVLNLQQSLSQNGTAVASYLWLEDGTKCGVFDNNNNGYDYMGSLIYSRSGSTRTLESASFGGGRFVNTNNTVLPYYYITDHLGSTRVITNNSGTIVEQNDYYPFGGRRANPSYAQTTVNRHKFNGKKLQTTGNTGFLDYGARMYDDVIGRWSVVDPMAEKQPFKTPYNFVTNNPINRIDPTGMIDAPIYDEKANFLGTDDEGLQGKAIVMNKDNFKQGMSHEDALSKSLGVEGLKGEGATSKLLDHYNGLKNRPDYDGYLTLDEANKWYREGNGQPLFTSLAKIDLSGIFSLGENYVGEKGSYNLLINSNSLNDGLVYGNITLKRYPNHQVRAYADEYNFEMHNAWKPSHWLRNAETVTGRKYAGEGKKFDINIYGSKN